MTAIKPGDRIRRFRYGKEEDGTLLFAATFQSKRWWFYRTLAYQSKVEESRIHTDGKPRKTGFTLLPRDGETK